MSWPPEITEFLYANADKSLGTRNGLVVQNAGYLHGLMWRCAVCNEEVREAHGVEMSSPVTYVIEAVCPSGHPQLDDD